MKDHEIRELVNSLRDVAVKYHNHQSLRERISMVLLPAIRPHDVEMSPTIEELDQMALDS